MTAPPRGDRFKDTVVGRNNIINSKDPLTLRKHTLHTVMLVGWWVSLDQGGRRTPEEEFQASHSHDPTLSVRKPLQRVGKTMPYMG